MKLKKHIKLTALLGVVTIAMFSSGCSTKHARNMHGKILKDAEGNYYEVERQGVGDCLFVRKLELPEPF